MDVNEELDVFAALRDNDIDIQKKLCRELFRRGNYLACYLFATKLIEMSEKFELISQLASLAMMGYTDLVYDFIGKRKQRLDTFMHLYDDIEMVMALLFLGEVPDEMKNDLYEKLRLTRNDIHCQVWLDMESIKNDKLSSPQEYRYVLKRILGMHELIKNPLIKSRVSYFLYCLGYTGYKKYIDPKYLRQEEKAKMGFALKNNIYFYEVPESIKRRVWYFNYSDEFIHFFTFPRHNIHFLRFEDEILVLDCGISPNIFEFEGLDGKDIERFLAEKGYSMEMIKGVFISHAHYDHYSCLHCFPGTIPVFMTPQTYDLIMIMNSDSIVGRDIVFMDQGKTTRLGRFSITPFSSGHILGGVGFDIRFGIKRLVFTGDFCLHDQMLLKGMDLAGIAKGGEISYLVSEHTYGSKDFAIKYEDAAKCLAIAVDLLVSLGIKVFIPAFSIGRSQEVICIINEYCKTRPRIIVDGMAREMTWYYASQLDDTLASNVVFAGSGDFEKNVRDADIVIASSGMLQPYTTALKYYDIFKNMLFGFIKTGYIEEQQYVHEMIKLFVNTNVHYFDIPLSAHSNYFELLHTFKALNPERLILVHGEGMLFS